MKPIAAILNALCALVSLVVVVITAGLILLDPNDYKGRLVDAVQDATGRTLTIGGDLRLTRSLWPTLEANDISLSNLPGGTRPDMAHAERIEGQLSVLALLRHEIDITRLTLIGPNILFEQVNGTPNWVFGRAVATPASAAASPAPASDPGAPLALRIETAQVRNGMVTWKLPARTKVVGIRSLDFQRARAHGPIEAHSTLVYSDNQPFSLDVAADPTGGVMDPWHTKLHFAAFDTDATAAGTMDVAGHYDLRVVATAGALAKLNALLPEMHLPAIRQVELSAQIGNGQQPGDIPVLGASTVRFASADLRDRVPGLVLGATRASLPAAGGQAAIDSTGQYAGAGFHLTGSAGVPTHPDGKVSLPVALKVETVPKPADGALTIKGTLALDTLNFAGLDAAASLQTAALAGLRPVLGASLPALTDLRFNGQVTIPAGAGTVRLRGVTLQTAQGDIAGDGSVNVDATPVVTGKWRSGTLDLDAMLTAFGIDLASPAPGATAGPMIPNTKLPWAALRGPTVDLTLGIGELHAQQQVWRDVAIVLSLKGGVLQAGPVTVAAPARMQAALTVDAHSAAAPVSLSLSAPALPLALLARYAGVPGPIAGAATVTTQLRAHGQTVRELASTLEGPFSITAVDGQLSNQTLIALTSAALDALGISVPPQGETKLTCFGLEGAFAGGIGTVKTIALETTYLSLEGAGQVDLGHETVAFKLQPMAVVAGSSVAVPVVVQGPFRNLSGKLDAGGLQQLGFLIDGLFGGDRSTACAAAGLKR